MSTGPAVLIALDSILVGFRPHTWLHTDGGTACGRRGTPGGTCRVPRQRLRRSCRGPRGGRPHHRPVPTRARRGRRWRGPSGLSSNGTESWEGPGKVSEMSRLYDRFGVTHFGVGNGLLPYTESVGKKGTPPFCCTTAPVHAGPWCLPAKTRNPLPHPCVAWLSSKLDGITPLFAPLLPEDLFRLIGIGHSGKGDISENKHQYLAEAYLHHQQA